MQIILNHSSMIPIYEQVVEQIRRDIINGTLRPHEPLPSVRGMAAQLRISALTVKKAYDRLEAEGYIVTVHGKGSYIAETDPQLAEEERRRDIAEEFAQVFNKAKLAGLSRRDTIGLLGLTREDIRQLIDTLPEEGKES